jgi:hypothetical protein
MGHGGDLSNLMPQGCMTTRTLYLVIGDMFLMHELRGIFCAQDDRFIMTFHTLSFRDMAISQNDTEMAFFTGDPPFDILFVIKVPTFYLNIPFGLDMTGRTPSDRTGYAFLFSFRASLVIVTDETVDFMNGQVASLNKLSVTTGTPEIHPPSQFP